MAKSFRVKLQNPPEDLVERAMQYASGYQATFSGDAHAGTFAWDEYQGHYTIKDDVVTFTLTHKPRLTPWSLIETRIRKILRQWMRGELGPADKIARRK